MKGATKKGWETRVDIIKHVQNSHRTNKILKIKKRDPVKIYKIEHYDMPRILVFFFSFCMDLRAL